jgi:hypothetical protein
MAVMSDVANARLMRSAISRRLDWGCSIGVSTNFSDYSLKQKGRHFCRPSLLETTQLDRSVSCYDRRTVTAEAVVNAQSDHIHVLADPVIEHSGKGGIGYRERIVGITHEEMIVFKTE